MKKDVQTAAERYTHELSRETKKLNRRATWIMKIMESQWPTFLLPITRVVEAIGIKTDTDFDRYRKDLVNILAFALNEYREGAERVGEQSGLMPTDIPDATRYAMYLTGLIQQLERYFHCEHGEVNSVLTRRRKKLAADASSPEGRSKIYLLVCSEPLQEYMRETGNEQTIIADTVPDFA